MSQDRKAPINTSGVWHTDVPQAEKQGQTSFVGSDTLPTEMDDATREGLLSLGVKFLGPVSGDPLFQYVELPEGLKKQATGHSLWSNLVDADGNVRASIFYKAASYDRSAFIRLV